MRKISYQNLQKKYSGKIVVLDKKEKRVVVAGEKFPQVFEKLENKGLNPKDYIFVGPVQKPGTINVYYFFLRAKNH